MARKGPQATKPGKYGTLRLYRVHYHDTAERGNAHTSLVWRYSTDHAYEAFEESDASDGWTISRVEPISESYARDHGLV